MLDVKSGHLILGYAIAPYYFTAAEHALSNIENRRIKISDILTLNDPFEFISLNVHDPELRRSLKASKAQMAAKSGIICFSRSWKHPLMWSHYADRHRGVCLGLDVDDQWTCEVSYIAKRVKITAKDIVANRVSERQAMKLVNCKANFWAYEKEVRVFCSTDERDSRGIAFRGFDRDIQLREVILGPECEVTRAQLGSALREIAEGVEAFKARLAFGSFNIVRNKNDALWK